MHLIGFVADHSSEACWRPQVASEQGQLGRVSYLRRSLAPCSPPLIVPPFCLAGINLLRDAPRIRYVALAKSSCFAKSTAPVCMIPCARHNSVMGASSYPCVQPVERSVALPAAGSPASRPQPGISFQNARTTHCCCTSVPGQTMCSVSHAWVITALQPQRAQRRRTKSTRTCISRLGNMSLLRTRWTQLARKPAFALQSKGEPHWNPDISWARSACRVFAMASSMRNACCDPMRAPRSLRNFVWFCASLQLL